MSTQEEIHDMELREQLMEDAGIKVCCFCGKTLDDYDHDNSCAECE